MNIIKKLIFYENNQIYVKNVIVLLSDKILKIAGGFVLSVFVARYFGPGKFGQIHYVTAFTGILEVFVIFGFDNIVLRDIGLASYPEPAILGTVVRIRLVLAAIIYSVGLAVFYFFFDKSLVFIYCISGMQLFMCSLYILRQWYQVKSLNKYTVIASQISFIVLCMGKIIVIILAKNVIWYAAILTGGTFIEIYVLFLLFKKQSGNASPGRFDINYCRHLFKSSLPLLFQGFAVMINMKIDQIMIGKMFSTQELGIYSIGVTLSEIVYFVPMAIVNAVYPKIIQAKKDGKNYESLIIKTGSLNVFVCLLFSLCCTLFAPFFVKLVYGEPYRMAGQIIQIYSWASILVAVAVSHGCYLIFNNMQKYSLYSEIGGAIVNVIGNIICIPLLGIKGAAMVTVGSYCFSGYFFYAFVHKKAFIMRTKSLFFKW
jgi:O-antigen/teichoic acid export membrane protein